VLGEQGLGRGAQAAAEVLDVFGGKGAGQGWRIPVDSFNCLQHKFTT
jgi:hypothetical protein